MPTLILGKGEGYTMKMVKIKCPSCDGALKISPKDKVAICPYCGSTFYLDDEMRNPSVVNINIEHYNAAPVAQRAASSELSPRLAAAVTC